MKKLTSVKLSVGSPLKSADLRYLTGFATTDTVAYLQQGRGKHLIVSLLEQARAKRLMPGVKIWSAAELKPPPGLEWTLSGRILALLKRLRATRVTVAPDFPLALARQLMRHKVCVQVAPKALLPARWIKTRAEQMQIRDAQKAAVQAMRAAVKLIAGAGIDRQGCLRHKGRPLTSEVVRAAIHQTLLAHNCTATGTIVASGRLSADPHEEGTGILRANIPIVIDIYPQHLLHGYYGDLTRTLVRGRPSTRLAQMHAAVKAAHQAALARIKPGVTMVSVRQAARDEMEKRGFFTSSKNVRAEGFIHNIGHGIGLEVHENLGANSRRVRLKPGQVLTIEPGLYYRDIGGVRIEDLVVVTRAGSRIPERCESFFRV